MSSSVRGRPCCAVNEGARLQLNVIKGMMPLSVHTARDEDRLRESVLDRLSPLGELPPVPLSGR